MQQFQAMEKVSIGEKNLNQKDIQMKGRMDRDLWASNSFEHNYTTILGIYPVD